MGYYLLLYFDGHQNARAPQWEEWDQEISNSLVDGGSAGHDMRVVTQEDAHEVDDKEITGYRVIKAENFDEAVEISKGAPPLYKGGRAEVYSVQTAAG
jgi:hypothetical protein